MLEVLKPSWTEQTTRSARAQMSNVVADVVGGCRNVFFAIQCDRKVNPTLNSDHVSRWLFFALESANFCATFHE